MKYYLYIALLITMSCSSKEAVHEKVHSSSSLTGKDLFNAVSGDLVVDLEPSEELRIGKKDLNNEYPVLWPYDDIEITSPYGFRLHPVLKTIKYHRGLDLHSPVGTRVVAVADGVVIKTMYNGVYGNLVEVEHKGGLITQYAHLNEILVFKGEHIMAGTLVGLTGSTGRSTGSHLHLGFIAGKHSVDPFYFIGRLWSEKNLSPEQISHLHGWK